MAYYEVRIAHLIRFLSSFMTSNEKEVYYTRAVCLRNEKSYFPYIGVDIQMEAISKCWFVAPLNIGLALIQIGTNVPILESANRRYLLIPGTKNTNINFDLAQSHFLDCSGICTVFSNA